MMSETAVDCALSASWSSTPNGALVPGQKDSWGEAPTSGHRRRDSVRARAMSACPLTADGSRRKNELALCAKTGRWLSLFGACKKPESRRSTEGFSVLPHRSASPQSATRAPVSLLEVAGFAIVALGAGVQRHRRQLGHEPRVIGERHVRPPEQIAMLVERFRDRVGESAERSAFA